MCDENCGEVSSTAVPTGEQDGDEATLAQRANDGSEAEAADRGWPRFLSEVFGDGMKFRRFMIALAALLVFLLAAGWVWGAGAAGLAALAAGVIRAISKRLGG